MDSKDQGYEILDDDEIVRTVTKQNVEEDASDTRSSVRTMYLVLLMLKFKIMLTKCLPRVERQIETTPIHLFMYRNLLQRKEGPVFASQK